MAKSGREYAAELVQNAMALGADQAQVMHTENTRFELDADTRRINLVRTTTNDEAQITVFRDGRKGSAAVNGRSPDAVNHALRDAVEAASQGPADEANEIASGVAPVNTTHGPPNPDRESMRDAVEAHLKLTAERYPELLTRHAIYSFEDTRRSFANSAGIVQKERRGAHTFGTMFAAKRGAETTSFSYTGATAYEPFQRLIDVGLVERTIADVCRSFDARSVPHKFEGDVIITPDCLSSLLAHIAGALGGYALMAGTSPFAEDAGKSVAAESFILRNTPRGEALPGGADFDGFGVPTRNVDIVRNGKLQNFLVNFFCARKLAREQTAGQLNLSVAPGQSSFEELVASTRRGIVFARFSGGNPNDNLDFSGVAKNSFYVEDGVIQYPLIETMVSGNLRSLLRNIRGLSRETVNSGSWTYPYVAAGGVTISGK